MIGRQIAERQNRGNPNHKHRILQIWFILALLLQTVFQQKGRSLALIESLQSINDCSRVNEENCKGEDNHPTIQETQRCLIGILFTTELAYGYSKGENEWFSLECTDWSSGKHEHHGKDSSNMLNVVKFPFSIC